MEIRKVCKSFDDLTARELYAIIRLRIDVFMVEQNCVFQDLDNKDQFCYHLMLFQANTLVAYARLVPKGLAYADAVSIGRVINSKQVRGTGMGKRLMEDAIRLCDDYYGHQTIKIGAQLYAKKFYGAVGFKQSGDVYLEDGIEHIEMTKDQ